MKPVRAIRGVLLALALLGTGVAHAHAADLLSVRADRDPAAPERVRQTLTLTDATLRLLLQGSWQDSWQGSWDGSLAAPDARGDEVASRVWRRMPLSAGGTPCALQSWSAGWSGGEDQGGLVELVAAFTCPPGALRQRFDLLDALPEGYRLIRAEAPGQDGPAGTAFADRDHPVLDLEGPGRAVDGFGGWVGQGVLHILGGADHLLFLLAVLLVGGSPRRILLLVTSFTLAHSLSLALTVLGVVTLSARGARWTEVAIAASILVMALENLFVRRHPHRAALTFLFGLVHGLGFASVLRGYGLQDAVVPGLVGFNLGVELGQAVVVAFLVPVLRILQRRPRLHSRVVRVSSIGLAGVGIFWMLARAVA